MKLVVQKAALAKAAKDLAPVLPRDVLSPFANVRLDAGEGSLTVTACDGSMQLERRLAAEVEEKGAVLVAGRAFVSFASAASEGLLTIDEVARGIRFQSGVGLAGIDKRDIKDWYAMTGPDESAPSMFLPAVTLAAMLEKTAWAMSRDGTRSALRGVRIEFAADKMTAVATDGRCLAVCEFETECPEAAATLPHSLVSLLASVLDEDENIRVQIGPASIRVTARDWSLTAKTVDAVYPLWRRVIPEQLSTSNAVVNREAFLDEVSRAALAAEDAVGIALEFKADSVSISARSQLSRYQAKLELEFFDGEPVKTRFNPALLKAALGHLHDETVRFALPAENHPALVVTCDLPWKAVVMPMRATED